MRDKLKGWVIGGIVGALIGFILLLTKHEISLYFVFGMIFFTLLGAFIGFIVSKMKNKSVWMGALIGVALYLILFLLGKVLNPFQPSHLVETSFLGRFLLYARMILLIPALIIGVLSWCEYPTGTFPPCAIIAIIITTIIYVLIGALIGFVVSEIKKGKRK